MKKIKRLPLINFKLKTKIFSNLFRLNLKIQMFIKYTTKNKSKAISSYSLFAANYTTKNYLDLNNNLLGAPVSPYYGEPYELESLKVPSTPAELNSNCPSSAYETALDPQQLSQKLNDLVDSTSNGTTSYISGPLDQFNVTSLVGLKFERLGKFYLAITYISLYLAIVRAVIIAIFYFGDNDSKLVPNKWSIVLETFFASLKGMVKDQIGLAYEVYLPLIFSIFFF